MLQCQEAKLIFFFFFGLGKTYWWGIFSWPGRAEVPEQAYPTRPSSATAILHTTLPPTGEHWQNEDVGKKVGWRSGAWAGDLGEDYEDLESQGQWELRKGEREEGNAAMALGLNPDQSLILPPTSCILFDSHRGPPSKWRVLFAFQYFSTFPTEFSEDAQAKPLCDFLFNTLARVILSHLMLLLQVLGGTLPQFQFPPNERGTVFPQNLVMRYYIHSFTASFIFRAFLLFESDMMSL